MTVQEVGRIVYTDRTEQEIVSMAGQHELDSWDLIEPTLCGALLQRPCDRWLAIPQAPNAGWPVSQADDEWAAKRRAASVRRELVPESQN